MFVPPQGIEYNGQTGIDPPEKGYFYVELTRQQVLHVARLANLSLTDEEVDHFAGELSRILDYVETLNRLPLPPPGLSASETPESPTSLREDAPRPSLPVESALSNAPDTSGGFFRVPRILEEGR